MARSREARARQAARRDAYADGVLGRIAQRQSNPTVHGMIWNEELAAALPNHVTESDRAKLMDLHMRGVTNDAAAAEFLKLYAKVMRVGVHQSEGGKIHSPRAGKAGTRGVWRADAKITPSWERKVAPGPAITHSCDDESVGTAMCPACQQDAVLAARARARHSR